MNETNASETDVYDLRTLGTTKPTPKVQFELLNKLEKYLSLEGELQEFMETDARYIALAKAPHTYLESNPDLVAFIAAFRQGDISSLLKSLKSTEH